MNRKVFHQQDADNARAVSFSQPATLLRLVALIVVACFFLVIAITMPAYSSDRDDQVKKRDNAHLAQQKAESSLEGINKDLAQAVLKLESLHNQLGKAQKDLAATTTRLHEHQQHFHDLRLEHRQAQDDLDTVTQKLYRQRDEQKAMNRELGDISRRRFRQGSTSTLALLLSNQSSADISDATQIAVTAARIQNERLDRLAKKLEETRKEEKLQRSLRDRLITLENQEAQAVRKTTQLQTQQASAVSHYRELENQQKATQAELDSKKQSLQADINEQKKLQQEAEKQIAKIDEENRRKALEAQQSNQPVPGQIFIHPIAGPLVVTSPYGYRIHPILGIRMLHAGVDIAAPVGKPQYAAAAGRVFFVAYDGTGGNTVKINHGIINGHSWITVYRHLSAFSVRNGQHVSQGQVIGLTGATGRVTGSHVHFEVWRDGTTINPMSLPGF